MGAERRLLRRLQQWFPAPADARVGNGDDAAVCKNRGRDSVLCVDPVVEGQHFDKGTDLRLVGRKAVNRNLSDLAAMGAAPDYLLVSLLLPPSLGEQELDRLLLGLRDAAVRGKCHVVGGDVSSIRGPLVVTVTAIGHLVGQPLQRSACRAGDGLFVTGPIGGSRLGRHLRFLPRLQEGGWLAAQRGIGGCIDISDGLLLDLWTMLQASGGLGAELDASRVPLHPTCLRRARGNRAKALQAALGEGEDHELLFTVRRGRNLPPGGPLGARARRPIGRVLAEPGLWLVEDGVRRAVAPRGHEHHVPGS